MASSQTRLDRVYTEGLVDHLLLVLFLLPTCTWFGLKIWRAYSLESVSVKLLSTTATIPLLDQYWYIYISFCIGLSFALPVFLFEEADSGIERFAYFVSATLGQTWFYSAAYIYSIGKAEILLEMFNLVLVVLGGFEILLAVYLMMTLIIKHIHVS